MKKINKLEKMLIIIIIIKIYRIQFFNNKKEILIFNNKMKI